MRRRLSRNWEKAPRRWDTLGRSSPLRFASSAAAASAHTLPARINAPLLSALNKSELEKSGTGIARPGLRVSPSRSAIHKHHGPIRVRVRKVGGIEALIALSERRREYGGLLEAFGAEKAWERFIWTVADRNTHGSIVTDPA